MSIKKQVFEYLMQHPQTTTEDLITAFPGAKKKSLWNYARQWKKNHGIQPIPKRDSIRQRVFAYINQNPDTTQKDLQAAFPDVNRISISNYRYQWRKTRPHLKRRDTVKASAFSYLEKHPEATFGELKKALPTTNPSSISAYQSIWKQARSQNGSPLKAGLTPKDESTQGIQQGRGGKTGRNKLLPSIADSKTAEDLIETLQLTIKTQEIAIEVMKEQNALLRSSQSETPAGLEGVSPDEWEQLRKMIAVFVRGLKNH